jgi:hypothetical protein
MIRYRDTEHLRVLIANERRDRLALAAPIVAALGSRPGPHERIVREARPSSTGTGCCPGSRARS